MQDGFADNLPEFAGEHPKQQFQEPTSANQKAIAWCTAAMKHLP